MTLLLNWRVWAAILLCVAQAAFGWKMYKLGGNSVQVEFDVYKNSQVLDALAAQKANQAKEQGMQLSLENLTNAYIKNQKTSAASAAAASNSLRDLQAALGDTAAIDPAAAARADDLTRARIVVGQCAGALQKMAAAFDASEERLSALQDYVKEMVQK